MAGILGVGADGKHVARLRFWLDTRCAPVYHEDAAKAAMKSFVKQEGRQFNPGPKILWWKHEHPEVFKKNPRAFVSPEEDTP